MIKKKQKKTAQTRTLLERSNSASNQEESFETLNELPKQLGAYIHCTIRT